MPAVAVARPTDPRAAHAPPRRRMRGSLLLAVVLAVAGSAVAFAAAAAAVVNQARQYDATPTDAILVLGAAQYWGTPSPVLANRLDHAAALYRRGVAPQIITVGGRAPGDRTTEAAAGAQYLVSKGIPASDIVVVPAGRDTLGSLRAVNRLRVRHRWESLTIVSDRSHLARSAAIAAAYGFRSHVNGPAGGDGALLTPQNVARESAGLLRFAAYDRWTLGPG